jgi:uncharacterized protein YceH (UPF0502 family)
MTLTPEEARVLGCLLEKERTTPDAYPLSLNGLVTACNQTTNRWPVVRYDDATVEAALDGLRERGLVRRGVYPGSRVIKYRHALDEELKLAPGPTAVLCVLLLRGPQTSGELKTRTERLHGFADLVALEDAIDALASHEDGPLVRRLEREPGQKEPRIHELLSSGAAIEAKAATGAAPAPVPAAPARSAEPEGSGARIAALEARVERLERDLEALRDGLGG